MGKRRVNERQRHRKAPINERGDFIHLPFPNISSNLQNIFCSELFSIWQVEHLAVYSVQ